MMVEPSSGVIAFRNSYIYKRLPQFPAVFPKCPDEVAEILVRILSPAWQVLIPIR
jgi:hypothetical protein